MGQLKEIHVSEVQVGRKYGLHGDLDPRGHDTVVRKVTRITDKMINCECGRRFVITENLHIYEWPWQ